MNSIFTKQAKEDGGELGFRHLFGPAQLADLAGMSEKEQVEANYGFGKDLLGGAPFHAAGYVADAFVPGAGSLITTPAGPLIHKTTKAIFDDEQDKNKTSLRHFFGPARALSYAGATPDQQVQANWDELKLKGGALGGAALGGTLAHYLSKDKSDSDYMRNMILSIVGGGILGRTGTFLGLRAKRRYDRGKEEEEKSRKKKKSMKKKAAATDTDSGFMNIIKTLVDGTEVPQPVPEDPNKLVQLLAKNEHLKTLADHKNEILQANELINKRNALRNALGTKALMAYGGGGALLGGLLNEDPVAGAIIGGSMGTGGVGGARLFVNLHKNMDLDKYKVSPRLAAIAGGVLGSLGSGYLSRKAVRLVKNED